jgi:hypothetical protein
MRKLILILPFLFACPVTDAPKKTEATTDEKTDTKSDEADKPAPEVSIFGFHAKTAMYKKGKDGASDTLELGGVDESVYSPDGKNTAEMMKIIESNMFPATHPTPAGYEGDMLTVGVPAIHAWVHWLDDKQAEISLRAPFYSAGAGTLKFDIEVIDGQLHEGSLGNVELKLQDCPDTSYVCAKSTLTACNKEIGPVGTCWNWLALNCLPCHCDGDMKLCVEKNPKCCGHEDEPCYPSRLGPHGWERYCL